MYAMQSPASSLDVLAGLQKHFGLSSFRPGQEEVVTSILSGRNTVVVMPTGAGKSLCYQLPATLLDGVTLVISPLISLMKDQVQQLEERGIPATYINSTLSDGERAERTEQMKQGAFKLVYVAPERFRSPTFVRALQSVQVDLFAIDEAHCISHWGHDFRPDYAQLGQVRKMLRPPRTAALTATATPQVQQDIARVLLLKDPQVFVAGFDRPNLFLDVQRVSGDDDKRRVCEDLMAEGGSGIVYCSTRKACESMQQTLTKRSKKVVLYHAGMTDDERHRAQDAFMSQENAVAVATNAFGMGINKPNIRFVAHANIPKAIEAYYQEIGRAGRDGKPSKAVLLFNHADVFTQERLISSNFPPDTVFEDIWDTLLTHEAYDEGVNALAEDVGASEFEVSAALKLLERLGKVARSSRGEGRFALTLTTAAKKVRPASNEARGLLHCLLENGAIGQTQSMDLGALAQRAGLTEEQTRHAIGLLERNGSLEVRRPFAGKTIQVLENRAFSDLELDMTGFRAQERQALLLLRRMTDYAYTEKCRRQFLLTYFGERADDSNCGHCDVCMGSSTAKKPTKLAARPIEAPAVQFAKEEMKRWRRELANQLDIPPYIIFNDATLYGLAEALPSNKREFMAVKGTGEVKWERFGPAILSLCATARALSADAAPEASSRKTSKTTRATR